MRRWSLAFGLVVGMLLGSLAWFFVGRASAQAPPQAAQAHLPALKWQNQCTTVSAGDRDPQEAVNQILGQWSGWELVSVTETRRGPRGSNGINDTATFSTRLLLCLKRPTG
jgi:hypothetical protein